MLVTTTHAKFDIVCKGRDSMFWRLLSIYIAFMLLLTALSWYVEPKLNIYSEEEIVYGREYADELLIKIDDVQRGAVGLGVVSRTKLCDYYLDGQDAFRDLKSAAVHMKGEQGEDFVYVLALAEDWCRNAAEAAYRPGNTEAKKAAEMRYHQARAELMQIRSKEYRRKE